MALSIIKFTCNFSWEKKVYIPITNRIYILFSIRITLNSHRKNFKYTTRQNLSQNQNCPINLNVSNECTRSTIG